MTCIYCAIGQKASTVRQVVATLEEHGALEYTAVVVALPGDMPALRYLAPYTACALGEYFMDHGGDALVMPAIGGGSGGGHARGSGEDAARVNWPAAHTP